MELNIFKIQCEELSCLPVLGRWLTRDPIGEIGGTKLYVYVNNNPENALDYLGLFDRQIHYPKTPDQDVDDFHARNGGYFDYSIRFKDGFTRRYYAWTHNLREIPHRIALEFALYEACCVEYFMISTHHSQQGFFYSQSRGVDAITDSQLSTTLKMCHNSKVVLNACYSKNCGDMIRAFNQDCSVEIRSIDGTSNHWPITNTPGINIPEFIAELDPCGGSGEKIMN